MAHFLFAFEGARLGFELAFGLGLPAAAFTLCRVQFGITVVSE